MELIALTFALVFSGTYGFGSILLNQNARTNSTGTLKRLRYF